MSEPEKPKPPVPAALGKPLSAPAIYYTEHKEVDAALKPNDDPKVYEISSNSPNRTFSMDTSDVIGIGVIILAIGSVLVAVIIALGLVFGKVPGKEGTEIILGSVGGAAISGVVGALFGRKGKAKRKAS